MGNWYIIIPLWFAVFMAGKTSNIDKYRAFNDTVKTIGGRYVTDVINTSYFSFDTLKQADLHVVQLTSDSFPAGKKLIK